MDRSYSDELKCWATLGMAARIDSAGVAKLIGFQEHDIPVLTRAGLLKPLGSPSPSSTKWFATIEIIELVSDRAWLDKATKRIGQYWLNKRLRQIELHGDRSSTNGHPQ